MTHRVLTAVGADRPGLVAALASVVEEFGGNWLTSELAKLAGSFAGIVLVELPDDRLAGFTQAVARMCDSVGLHVRVEAALPVAPTGPARGLTLHLVGHDRPGIVGEISSALAAQHVTIEEMSSDVADAAQAGGTLFEARLLLRVPDDVADDDVRRSLEVISAELMVDVEVESVADSG